jgi:microcystin-dependent protein
LRADGTFATPVSASIPTGTVATFAVSTPPSGWLNCDGSAVSRTTFATLFSVIGTVYGNGNGSTTFNVPDMRGRTVAGYDPSNSSGRLTGTPTGGVSAATIANTGGEQGHTLTAPGELPSHTHTVNDPAHTHSYSDGGHTHIVFDPGHLHTIDDPGHVHTASTPINNTASFGTGANPPSASAAGTIDNEFNQTTTLNVTGVSNQSNTTGIFNEMEATGIAIRTGTTGITNANTGSGGTHNTVQPTMILSWIIKT